jgi:glycerophosphoryl diester phosphodiesterase
MNVRGPGIGAGRPRPLLVAHRVGNAPETIAAAVEAGADVIEADVHLYRGRIEVRHTKTMGPLPWLWDRWYLVPASDPRIGLDALLAAAPPEVILMLDLKGWQPWLGRAVAREMERIAPDRPYVVCGRAWPMFAHFADHVHVVVSAKTRREVRRLPRRIRMHRTDGVSLHRPLLARRDLVGLIREHTDVLFTWPIATTDAARDALDAGATGLTVDGIDVIAALAASRLEHLD